MEAMVEIISERAEHPIKTLSLVDLLQPVVQRLLGGYESFTYIRLLLVPIPEKMRGEDLVQNLTPEYGYGELFVYDHNYHLLYRHPHALAELIAEPLAQQLQAEYPEQRNWGYRLQIGPVAQNRSLRPTPRVQGLHREPLGRPPRLQIRRLPEEPPPLADFADFGLAPPSTGAAPVVVLLSPELHQRLSQTLPLSDEVEEGGFLVGRVFSHRGQGPEFLVVLDDAPKARHSGASLLHFTFTGDSFAAIRRELPENRNSGRLVGWYHTHLFPAREEMGLSTIDVDLHGSTFLQPWQLAGLINLESGRRVLRFYALRERRMQTCPYFLLPAAEVCS